MGSLRLRATYGQSGVQPSPVASLPRDSLFTALVGGVNTNGAALSAIGNPDLKPERQTEIEAGVDADLASERIHAELTYYRRQSQGALINQPIAPSFGIVGPLSRQINVGKVLNRGLEGLISARVLDRRDLSWELGLNGFINVNRLVTLAPVVPSIGTIIRQAPGYPLNSLFDRQILGYKDANGNGILEATEVTLAPTPTYVGPIAPPREITGTTALGLLGNRVRVSVLVDYRGGNKRFNNIEGNRCSTSFANCRAINDPSAPLDQQAAAVARNNPGVIWTGYLEDGSFARLRETSLSFSDPRLGRLFGARGGSLVFAARNLATWTRYSGLDPESTNGPGADAFADNPTAPPARIFTLRLSLDY
jgi:hypothetical protein